MTTHIEDSDTNPVDERAANGEIQPKSPSAVKESRRLADELDSPTRSDDATDS